MKRIPIPHAIVLFIAWVLITIVPGLLLHKENVPLEETVSKGFSYSIFSAALLLLIYVFARKVGRLVGFERIRSKGNWILIYPVIVIALSLTVGFFTGVFGNVSDFGWLFVNTIFVGISEELMFRGVVLSSLARKFSFWKSAIIISAAFGSIHVLNGFTTGDFGQSLMQSLLATSSGFLFLDIRVKTGSIIPAMVLHWLWDFTAFTANYSGGEATNIDSSSIIGIITGLVLVVSPLVFGITGVVQLLNKEVVSDFMKTQRNGTDTSGSH